jgi:hypothetical protein
MSNATITRYTIEVGNLMVDGDIEVIDDLEVYAYSLTGEMAEAYMAADNAYIETYGPSVMQWMRLRLTNTDTGKNSKWYSLNELGEVEA